MGPLSLFLVLSENIFSSDGLVANRWLLGIWNILVFLVKIDEFINKRILANPVVALIDDFADGSGGTSTP